MFQKRKKMREDLFKTYELRLNNNAKKKKKLKKRLHVFTFLRVLVFFVLVYGTYKISIMQLYPGIVFFILVSAVFIFLIKHHADIKYQLNIVDNLIRINKQEIEALRGSVDSFEAGEKYKDHKHEFSNDLELFGNKGLFQYLNRCSSYSGSNQLANWLKNPLQNKQEIVYRQEAVKEIREKIDWRQGFAAIGNMLSLNDYDDARLISWSKVTHHLPRESFLRLFIYLSPALVLTGLALYILDMLPIGYTIIVLLINRFFLYQYGNKIQGIHSAVTSQLKVLRNYSRLFHHIENQDFDSKRLAELKNALSSHNIRASKIIKRLYRITDALDNTSNLFIEAVLNTVFLYSIHLVFRLESWHRKYASSVEQWIESIGYFDAYNSLGNFCFNHTHYTFPEITEETVFEAESLGHPLISQEDRVNNNFSITKKGSIFIVTGANMAGKSTFLRTIGTNLVLAMNGAPVCADKLTFRITELFTSMNITDSLSMNESYFYAEVKRLRQLVDKASSADNIMVLLDEILTGTNTRDKEIASKAFLERLINMQVTSIIATHDLSLTSLEKTYPDKISNKSFEVDLVDGEMKYNYKIREGVAQNMNALELLKNMKLIT